MCGDGSLRPSCLPFAKNIGVQGGVHVPCHLAGDKISKKWTKHKSNNNLLPKENNHVNENRNKYNTRNTFGVPHFVTREPNPRTTSRLGEGS
jgi:hypothetical protein